SGRSPTSDSKITRVASPSASVRIQGGTDGTSKHIAWSRSTSRPSQPHADTETWASVTELRKDEAGRMAEHPMPPLPLRRTSCRFRYRFKRGTHGTDRRLNLVAQLVPFREPTRLVVRKPCVARSILPNQFP